MQKYIIVTRFTYILTKQWSIDKQMTVDISVVKMSLWIFIYWREITLNTGVESLRCSDTVNWKNNHANQCLPNLRFLTSWWICKMSIFIFIWLLVFHHMLFVCFVAFDWTQLTNYELDANPTVPHRPSHLGKERQKKCVSYI